MAVKKAKRTIDLRNVVINFPNIFAPKGFQGGTAKYSAHFMIDKLDTAVVEQIKTAMKDAMEEQWPGAAPKLTADKNPFKDGDDKTWGGYANHFFISAKNNIKPKVFDIDGTDLTIDDEFNTPGDKPQGGDIVNARIEIVCLVNEYGKQVIANLAGVQFVKEGNRFNGGDSAQDMFADTTVAKPASAKPAASNTANVFARNGSEMFAETTMQKTERMTRLHPESGPEIDDIFG